MVHVNVYEIWTRFTLNDHPSISAEAEIFTLTVLNPCEITNLDSPSV